MDFSKYFTRLQRQVSSYPESDPNLLSRTWSFEDLESLLREAAQQETSEMQVENKDTQNNIQFLNNYPSSSSCGQIDPLFSTTEESNDCPENIDYLEEKQEKRLLGEESEETKSSEKESKSQYQNRMKDHQGMIAAKIKKSCKRNKKTGEDTRIFIQGTRGLSQEKREEFREWARSYNKKDKTWRKLKEFLNSNAEFGVLFAHMAILLLSEEFENEYEAFINEGKMNQINKELLKEKSSKEFYTLKFDLALDELLGIKMDFNNEMKKSRKTVQRIQAKTMGKSFEAKMRKSLTLFSL